MSSTRDDLAVERGHTFWPRDCYGGVKLFRFDRARPGKKCSVLSGLQRLSLGTSFIVRASNDCGRSALPCAIVRT